MAHRKTLTQLRTIVRDGLDESTASFWTDAELNRRINEAAQRVWMDCRKLKDDFFLTNRASTDGSLTILSESYSASSFQIVAGTKTYTLPPDLAELKLIECITSNYEDVTFTHKDMTNPYFRANRRITSNLSPIEFMWDVVGERTLVLDVASDTTLDLRLWYVQILAELSGDSSELELPHPLYLAVVEYAIASSQMKDRDGNSASHEARARQIINDFFGAHSRQSSDVETAVAFLEGY